MAYEDELRGKLQLFVELNKGECVYAIEQTVFTAAMPDEWAIEVDNLGFITGKLISVNDPEYCEFEDPTYNCGFRINKDVGSANAVQGNQPAER